MDKVKSVYRVNGRTVRLQDPEHFYRWLEQQDGLDKEASASHVRSNLSQYVSRFPRKVQPA